MSRVKIFLKNEDQIQIMRENGRIIAEIFQKISETIQAGMSTYDLDKITEEYIISKGGIPSFKGYDGFPGSICSSVNEQVIHGIPSKEAVLEEGDIIGIDIGVYKDGFHADSARTFKVGKVDSEKEKLCEVTALALKYGIASARKGKSLFDISNAIQTCTEDAGFSIVREFVGHGVGKDLHEAPQIPNYRQKGLSKIKLRAGMTLAIEPMVNAGTKDIIIKKDGWTICTADGKPSAHFEHSIAITEKGPIILTTL